MRTSKLILVLVLTAASSSRAGEWKFDPVWHDGLAEKAVYSASRVVYGQPRAYEAIFFTNKEQHDAKTLTKAGMSRDTIEVFKHNQIELIPTPNYDYKYVTTSHLTVNDLELTRLDCSSQEFCGTSFKQYLRQWPSKVWNYWSFSYMPESGRRADRIVAPEGAKVVAEDSLPLFLRSHDFASPSPWKFLLLPTQRSNRATPSQPVEAELRNVGEDGDSHKIELWISDALAGTYWMAKDRLHVMTRYESADQQQMYELKDLSRVNYWSGARTGGNPKSETRNPNQTAMTE